MKCCVCERPLNITSDPCGRGPEGKPICEVCWQPVLVAGIEAVRFRKGLSVPVAQAEQRPLSPHVGGANPSRHIEGEANAS